MTASNWLGIAQRLNALARNGLAFSDNHFDKERYLEIEAISMDMTANVLNVPLSKIIEMNPADKGYQTPKVDIRAVVLNEQNELLMVREKMDGGNWSLPGGWADIGFTPFEVAHKEVLEETGLIVKATRLLAVFDKKNHPHPPQPWYVYKFYILCEALGGQLLIDTTETNGSSWIHPEKISQLSLSVDRITQSQLDLVLNLAANPSMPVHCD